MNQPESFDDVWPHEEIILAVSESGECFDRSIERTVDDILENSHLDGEDLHDETDLSAYSICTDFEDLDGGTDLIPNSLLIVEHSVLDKGFRAYLDGTTIPRSTWVVIYVDNNEPAETSVEITRRAKRSIEVVDTRTELLTICKSYFRTICPICSGDSARAYVLNWSKAVYQRVEN